MAADMRLAIETAALELHYAMQRDRGEREAGWTVSEQSAAVATVKRILLPFVHHLDLPDGAYLADAIGEYR